MYLYFNLDTKDLNVFCENYSSDAKYKVNNIVKIIIIDIYGEKQIINCKLVNIDSIKRFLTFEFLDVNNVFEKCDSIELVSFVNNHEHIRVKIFRSLQDVLISYNSSNCSVQSESTEKKKPTNNLNETFTFINGARFKNKKYDSSILFDVLDLYPKEETKMAKIKDIKLNGPATILFTTDNKKVVVKCRPGDNYDPEKGILMVLCKYIYNSNTNHNNWTEIFDIPYKDEIDVEKVIAMSIVKEYFYKNDKDWHYNYVLKYMYNAIDYPVEDRVKALKALDYSVERIARCLGITKGLVKDILEIKNKTVWETAKENFLSYLDRLKKVSIDNKPKITVTGTKDPYIESLLKEKPELKNNTNPYKVPDHKPCNMEELPKGQQDVITDQNIIDLFNKGYSISKISKELGLTEYFVKKYLDAYTNPKTEKKADKILKKAVKNSKKEKKPRGGYHKRLTEIAFPSYLTKEESEDILEKTKVKYEGKYKCMSVLQKYFDRECKHFAINKFYGNGYSAFELGQMLGVSAAAIMRMRNNPI